MRIWKSANGKQTTVAALLEVRDDQVFIRTREGEDVLIPLNKLSDTDKQYVKRSLVPGTHSATNDHAGKEAAAKSPATPRLMFRTHTKDRVASIAYSPDGKLIAIANGNPTNPLPGDWKRTVTMLDGETGKSLVELELTTDEENAFFAGIEGFPNFEVGPLAFSPDGNVLAVGNGFGQVKLFATRLVTGALGRTFDDQQAKLAEKTMPQELKLLSRAMGGVAGLAFSPDGSLFVTCGSSFDDAARNMWGERRLGRLATGPGRLKVWDVKTGALKHDLVGHSHAVAVAFSADGNLLASAGRWGGDRDDGTGVIIWNPQTDEQIRRIETKANGGTHAVAFAPNRKLVAIGSRMFDKENDTSTTTISLVFAASGITHWQRTVPGWVNPKAFSPDGKSVVALGEESIQFFDVETGNVTHAIGAGDAAQGRRWVDIAVGLQGRRLAAGGATSEKQGFVEIWDLAGAAASGGTPDNLPQRQ